jgi:tetratricopeptide (TPR) repeat protein
MRKLAFWISFLSLVIATPAVSAASREAKERAAKRACLNGDPAKGVELLTDLYIDSNDPNYLFNQGRCYEQNSRYEDAVGRFREYLRKVTGSHDADKADVKSAERHIADCEKLLGRRVAEPVQPASEPGTPPPPPLPPPLPEPQSMPYPTVALPRPQPAPASPHGGGLRIAGIVTASVGAAALVAGLVLNIKANSMVSDAQDLYDRDTYSSSKDYKTMSMIGYGVGAACVAGGALLYFLGVRAGSQVAVTPVVAQGTAGVLVGGTF